MLPPRPGRGNKPGNLSTSSLTNPARQDSLPRPRDAGPFCRSCGAWRGSFGLEPDPWLYIEHIVAVFREVRRVLRKDGTLWLNLGDCYTGGGNGGGGSFARDGIRCAPNADKNRQAPWKKNNRVSGGFKPKDLVGLPWRVAFALQADGWWLRSALPWVKRNGMPESTTDRPATALEYVFMLTRSARYFYDAEAVRRAASPATNARVAQDTAAQAGSPRANGGAKSNGPMKAVIRRPKRATVGSGIRANDSFENATCYQVLHDRNFRNADLFFDSLVPPFGLISLADGSPLALDVTSQPFKEAHFATFPPRLVEPLIHASCPAGGLVLDPFGGSGTTGLVADRLGRHAILIDLNPSYAAMSERRIRHDAGMFAAVVLA